MAGQKRVVILESNADLRAKLLFRLSQEYKWVKFVGAATLTEARGLISAEPTSLIIVDIYQGEMSPVETVQRLKRAHGKIELLALCRPEQEGSRRAVYEAGAAYMLTVPTEPALLKRTVTEALTTPRLHVTRIRSGHDLCARIVPCLDGNENITIVVEGPGAVGEIYVSGGSIVSAGVGELGGEKALDDILSARDSDVFVRNLSIVPKRLVSARWSETVRRYAADEEAYWQSRPEAVRKLRSAPASDHVEIELLDEDGTTDTPTPGSAAAQKLVGRKLGKVMFRLGKVSEEGLRAALTAQLKDKGSGKRVGHYFVKTGCSIDDVREGLAAQKGVRIEDIPVDAVDTDFAPPAVAAEEIHVELLPDEVAGSLPEAAVEFVEQDSQVGPGIPAADPSEAKTAEGDVPRLVSPLQAGEPAEIKTIEPEDEDEAEPAVAASQVDASEARTRSGPVAVLPVKGAPTPAAEPDVSPDELLDLPDIQPVPPKLDVQLSPDDFIPGDQLVTGASIGSTAPTAGGGAAEEEPVELTPVQDVQAPAGAEEPVELLEVADEVPESTLSQTLSGDAPEAGATRVIAPESSPADDDDVTRVAKPIAKPGADSTGDDDATRAVPRVGATRAIPPEVVAAAVAQAAPATAEVSRPSPVEPTVGAPKAKAKSQSDSVEMALDELWAAKSAHAADEAAKTTAAGAPGGRIFAPADPPPASGPARLGYHCKHLVAEVEGALAAGVVCLKSGTLLGSHLADDYPTEPADLPASGFAELLGNRVFGPIDDAVRRQSGNGAAVSEEILFTGAATQQFVRRFARRDAAMVLVTARGESAAAGWKALRSAMEAAQGDLPT